MSDKTCLTCGVSKSLDDFTKNKRRKDGYCDYCKPCNREKQSAWRFNKIGGITHPLKTFNYTPAPERFHRFYEKSEGGCWIWKGSPRGSNNYGRITVNKTIWTAHRYSWFLENGEIPEGMMVLHHCDTPLCVNPKHLFVGDNQANCDDKVAKNRQAQGPNLGAAIRAGYAKTKGASV